MSTNAKKRRKIDPLTGSASSPDFFLVLSGVGVPREIVLCIIECCGYDRGLLDGFGLVNHAVNELVLPTWKGPLILSNEMYVKDKSFLEKIPLSLLTSRACETDVIFRVGESRREAIPTLLCFFDGVVKTHDDGKKRKRRMQGGEQEQQKQQPRDFLEFPGVRSLEVHASPEASKLGGYLNSTPRCLNELIFGWGGKHAMPVSGRCLFPSMRKIVYRVLEPRMYCRCITYRRSHQYDAFFVKYAPLLEEVCWPRTLRNFKGLTRLVRLSVIGELLVKPEQREPFPPTVRDLTVRVEGDMGCQFGKYSRFLPKMREIIQSHRLERLSLEVPFPTSSTLVFSVFDREYPTLRALRIKWTPRAGRVWELPETGIVPLQNLCEFDFSVNDAPMLTEDMTPPLQVQWNLIAPSFVNLTHISLVIPGLRIIDGDGGVEESTILQAVLGRLKSLNYLKLSPSSLLSSLCFRMGGEKVVYIRRLVYPIVEDGDSQFERKEFTWIQGLCRQFASNLKIRLEFWPLRSFLEVVNLLFSQRDWEEVFQEEESDEASEGTGLCKIWSRRCLL